MYEKNNFFLYFHLHHKSFENTLIDTFNFKHCKNLYNQFLIWYSASIFTDEEGRMLEILLEWFWQFYQYFNFLATKSWNKYHTWNVSATICDFMTAYFYRKSHFWFSSFIHIQKYIYRRKLYFINETIFILFFYQPPITIKEELKSYLNISRF